MNCSLTVLVLVKSTQASTDMLTVLEPATVGPAARRPSVVAFWKVVAGFASPVIREVWPSRYAPVSVPVLPRPLASATVVPVVSPRRQCACAP